MKLATLFDTQRVLDQKIIDKHPELKGQDNLEWKVLALQVELGECANEHRGFKKWSDDQEPRTFKREKCPYCAEREISIQSPPRFEVYWCGACAGRLVIDTNPLLEEYVDCLHFILSIGIELGFTDIEVWGNLAGSITKQFLRCFDGINSLHFVICVNGKASIEIYERLFGAFIGLGEWLGFTWEQIEQAYFEKNAINHNRQDSGY
jgi:dimeric dUTPase (all-alpha-NTP-PPase superfamily)